MKNPTEPNANLSALPHLYERHDILRLFDTHAVRIDETSKDHGSWDHDDVYIVRHTIRAWLRHYDLLPHVGHPMPLYWLHDWLTHGRCDGSRTPNPDAANAAHLRLISALNQPYSGLAVVAQRWTQHAS